jgi:hypothetical protein
MIRTNISDKLREIVAAIDQRGSVNLTRLTVLKKWFEASSRLSSFAIFIADQASRPKTKTTKDQRSFIARRVLCWRTWMYFLLRFRVRRPQHCMHVFGHSKTSIGTYCGERSGSFMITICSWSSVGSTFIWGMEIRRPKGIGLLPVTVNTTIRAMERASMVPAAGESKR